MRTTHRREGVIAAGLTAAVMLTILLASTGAAIAKSLPNRPDFRLPFACGSRISLTTYVGHNPDDKKVDMYRAGYPENSPILASASGYVHEEFYPGGIEIDHGHGWFTVYLHMKSHVHPGIRVRRGQKIGVMGKVGTGVVHLHYEQLYHPGSHDADNADIVRPLIQGRGPIKMEPKHPISMKSTNCGKGKLPKPTKPTKPTPKPSPPTPPAPSRPAPLTKYYVTTFANAPGRSTPGGTQTGTLYAGRNYVYCKAAGPLVKAGRDFNHWWLKTDLDVGPANQWVSAYYLKNWGNHVAKDDRGRTIPTC